MLLIRIFGSRRWLRIISILTLVVWGAAVLAGNCYNAAKCVPPNDSARITPAFLLNCSRTTNRIGIILGTIGVVTDAVIFALPLPIIAKLHLPLGKRIGIIVVFLAGAL